MDIKVVLTTVKPYEFGDSRDVEFKITDDQVIIGGHRDLTFNKDEFKEMTKLLD